MADADARSPAWYGNLAAALGLVALLGPAFAYLALFPPPPGRHSTSIGLPGLVLLTSGIAPAFAAGVLGVRALTMKPVYRSVPVAGIALGAVGAVVTGLLWFFVFFVGY